MNAYTLAKLDANNCRIGDVVVSADLDELRELAAYLEARGSRVMVTAAGGEIVYLTSLR